MFAKQGKPIKIVYVFVNGHNIILYTDFQKPMYKMVPLGGGMIFPVFQNMKINLPPSEKDRFCTLVFENGDMIWRFDGNGRNTLFYDHSLKLSKRYMYTSFFKNRDVDRALETRTGHTLFKTVYKSETGKKKRDVGRVRIWDLGVAMGQNETLTPPTFGAIGQNETLTPPTFGTSWVTGQKPRHSKPVN